MFNKKEQNQSINYNIYSNKYNLFKEIVVHYPNIFSLCTNFDEKVSIAVNNTLFVNIYVCSSLFDQFEFENSKMPEKRYLSYSLRWLAIQQKHVQMIIYL